MYARKYWSKKSSSLTVKLRVGRPALCCIFKETDTCPIIKYYCCIILLDELKAGVHCRMVQKVSSDIEKDDVDKKLTNLAWNIIPFSALPEWLKDNEFIRGSYRPPMFSFRGCFKSMFRLHNETWNIWTHFAGFLFFVVLVMGVYIFEDYITWLFEDLDIYKLPWTEQAMLWLFFGGAIVCMLCSTLFHILHSHSRNINEVFSRLDYSGIALLITGSSIPAYYYGFYCTWKSQYTHIGILIILCVICIAISMKSTFNTPRYRAFRFMVFVLFGLYGVVPFVHIYLRDGYALARHAYALWGIVTMAVLYVGGGALYALRIPERFWPGRFDIWASSHQLFHICVVTAALVHYDCLLAMAKYRLNVSCMESMELVIGA